MSRNRKLFGQLTDTEQQVLLDEVENLKTRLMGYLNMPLEESVFAECCHPESPYFRGVPNEEYAKIRSIANSLEPIPQIDWLNSTPISRKPKAVWNTTYWTDNETAARALVKQLSRDLQSIRRCGNSSSQLTCNLYALKTAQRVAAAIEEGV